MSCILLRTTCEAEPRTLCVPSCTWTTASNESVWPLPETAIRGRYPFVVCLSYISLTIAYATVSRRSAVSTSPVPPAIREATNIWALLLFLPFNIGRGGYSFVACHASLRDGARLLLLIKTLWGLTTVCMTMFLTTIDPRIPTMPGQKHVGFSPTRHRHC